MTRIGIFIKELIKSSSLLMKIINWVRQPTGISPLLTSIGEITPLDVRKSGHKDERINILVPSINKEHVFGGIATALFFFDRLAELKPIKKRIITTDATPDEEARTAFRDYTLVQSDMDEMLDFEIVGFGDRYDKTIPVGENDYFVTTAWWTTHHAQKIVRWQKEIYGKPQKKITYLIQDFEPGFYPWSSQYALADSTYRSELSHIAVFNSSLLHSFFKNNNYAFDSEFVFEPVLNSKLKKGLENPAPDTKKKQILIYGRPGVDRNVFPLIIETLKLWVWQQPGVHDWKLLSVGEKHPDIELGNGMVLTSGGKLSLEGYVEALKESAVGISLMVSPHPSYPPLEMAMFGVGVISNTYANKELSDWHENITSINLSIDNLIAALSRNCNEFTKDSNRYANGKLLKEDYMDLDNQFNFLEDLGNALFEK